MHLYLTNEKGEVIAAWVLPSDQLRYCGSKDDSSELEIALGLVESRLPVYRLRLPEKPLYGKITTA